MEDSSMGNRLFQYAKEAVHQAEENAQAAVTPEQLQEVQTNIEKAQNQLSSAFANSTPAEQFQLQELQQRLDQVKNDFYH